MKILHVCKKYPNALGGDAIVVANLQKQQQAAGHHVAVVTSNCKEIQNQKYIYKFGLQDTPAHLDDITPKRLMSLVMLFFRIFTILRKERPAIIHTHSVDMAFVISFAARFYHIPIIHTFHIVTFYDATQSTVRRITELWLAKMAGLRQTTAPNSYDVKKLRAAGLAQTVLLPNGVDMAFWEKTTRTQPQRTFLFVAIGRLEHQKGYQHLITAASRLAGMTRRPFHVAIVGEGSQKAALGRRIRELYIEDIVTLVGRKSAAAIRTVLSRANAVVLPSLYETTPLTLLEAWAAGVPAIVTPVGILHGASADFGAAYIVPSKDDRALAAAMDTCMNDDAVRHTIAMQGQKEARKYAWPRIARIADRIYRSAV